MDQFDGLISDVIDELPGFVLDCLDNTCVICESGPVPPSGKPNGFVLGLYNGYGKNKPGFFTAGPVFPARITLFYDSFARLYSNCDRNELRRKIKMVIVHEIGHNFGFTEVQLQEAGYGADI